MDCPVCRTAMITCQLDHVEVDYCTCCLGIWLDAGELEVLLGTSERTSALLSSFRPVVKYSESTRKCPICLKKMEKILAGAEPVGLLIDKCSNGHGLWFDRNELADILAVGSFDDERKIQSLLAEIFGQPNRPAEDKNRNGKF